MNLNRKLRMGMVGGGRGAFIGGVHRMAARLDGEIDLVAGCFSSDPAKSKASGADLHLDPARVYSSYAEMAKSEAALSADRRIDFAGGSPVHSRWGASRGDEWRGREHHGHPRGV